MPQPSRGALERCSYCQLIVLHELLRFRVESSGGTWPICASCIRSLLDELEHAHAEAGEALEQLWSLG